MSQQDDDLKTLWQSTPHIDTADLLRRVARERRRMIVLFWAEVVSAVLTFGMIWAFDAMSFFGDRGGAVWAVLIAAMGFQVWMWLWRRGLWDAVSEAPMDLLNLQLKRATVGLKLARYYAYGTPIATLLGFALSHYVAVDAPVIDVSDLARVAILAGLVAMIVAMTVSGFIMMRRYRARINWIRSRISELSADVR